MSKSAKALLLVMVDIDPSIEAEFNRWYDEEHIPERLSCPGFISARRFTALEGGPKYLAIYELENPQALNSPEYERFKAAGMSEWTKRILPQFKNLARNVYVEMLPPPTE